VPFCARLAVVPAVIRARHYVLLPQMQIGSSVQARVLFAQTREPALDVSQVVE
jgi:hypothetical protein